MINYKGSKILYVFQEGILGCGNSKKSCKEEKNLRVLTDEEDLVTKTNRKVSGRGHRNTLFQNLGQSRLTGVTVLYTFRVWGNVLKSW